jgi:hypothetical protein
MQRLLMKNIYWFIFPLLYMCNAFASEAVSKVRFKTELPTIAENKIEKEQDLKQREQDQAKIEAQELEIRNQKKKIKGLPESIVSNDGKWRLEFHESPLNEQRKRQEKKQLHCLVYDTVKNSWCGEYYCIFARFTHDSKRLILTELWQQKIQNPILKMFSLQVSDKVKGFTCTNFPLSFFEAESEDSKYLIFSQNRTIKDTHEHSHVMYYVNENDVSELRRFLGCYKSAFTSDSKWLVTQNDELKTREICVYHLEKAQCELVATLKGLSFELSPNGTYMAVLDENNITLIRFDLIHKQIDTIVIERVIMRHDTESVSFCDNKLHIKVSEQDDSSEIDCEKLFFDKRVAQASASLVNNNYKSTFTNNGQWLITLDCSQKNKEDVHVSYLEGGQYIPVQTIKGHSFHLSPQDKYMAVVDLDKVILVEFGNQNQKIYQIVFECTPLEVKFKNNVLHIKCADEKSYSIDCAKSFIDHKTVRALNVKK